MFPLAVTQHRESGHDRLDLTQLLAGPFKLCINLKYVCDTKMCIMYTLSEFVQNGFVKMLQTEIQM